MRSFQNPLSDDFYKTRLHKRGKNRDSIFSRAVLLKSGKRREEEREEERERKREREKRYRRQEPVKIGTDSIFSRQNRDRLHFFRIGSYQRSAGPRS